MKTEQDFLDALQSQNRSGHAKVVKVVNAQLRVELKTTSFARRATRHFSQQYIFDNGPKKVSVPTFDIMVSYPANRPFTTSKHFGDVVSSLAQQIAAKENEVLVNIVKWSAEAAEAETTDGMKPLDIDYDWDLERLLYPMGAREVQPNFVVFHPVDYHRYVRRVMFREFLETDREKWEKGIMGYYTPGAFGKNHRVTIMQSCFVEQLRPIILGSATDDEIQANNNRLDLILTEHEAPTLSIEEGRSGLVLTLKETIGICASGNYVQQVRLPEWKESQF